MFVHKIGVTMDLYRAGNKILKKEQDGKCMPDSLSIDYALNIR